MKTKGLERGIFETARPALIFTAMLLAAALPGCKKVSEPVAPTVTTVASVTEIVATAATAGGAVMMDGEAAVSARGVCWDTAPEPTTAGNKSTDGEGLGAFTSKLTGLTPGTKYYLRAYAVNSAGTGYGKEVSFTTPDAEASVATAEASLITPDSAISGGTASYDGGGTIAERGVCWGIRPSPATDGSKATAGMGSGEFTAKLTGLIPGIKYYARAYAINSAGTAYGNEITFTTPGGKADITTAEAVDITAVSARSGGNAASDGGAAIFERGVCWGTVPQPTIEGDRSVGGSGIGEFTADLRGLTPGTRYYVRAYATNGIGTDYGNTIVFTTPSGEATVTTVEADNIRGTSARSGGNVSGDGGSPVTAKGVCWSTSHDPTIENDKSVDCPGTGDFRNDLTGLDPTTRYYVRAYATNELGDTYYGNEMEFTTTGVPVDITPGTLQRAVESLGLEDASSIALSGSIDQRDFAYMKSMVDSRSLKDIDLSGVTVAAYGEYPANEIPSSAFDGSSSLVSFVFPAKTTSIATRAFYYCKGLTGSLAIPDGVVSIGNDAFFFCTGFTGSLTIGSKVKTIGSDAFLGCVGFTGSLVIPDSVTSIGDGAFLGCIGFTGSLTIGDGVTSIGARAFSDCAGFTGSLVIPDGVVTIMSSAFYDCAGFTGSLTIGGKVETIENDAFLGCIGLSGSLTIPGSVISIGDYVFFGCTGFNGSLTIYDGVTSIGSGAFSDCSGFTGSLVIPGSVISMGYNAFDCCNALSDIKVAWMAPIAYNGNMLPSGKTVYVPAASVAAYQSASGWKNHPIEGY